MSLKPLEVTNFSVRYAEKADPDASPAYTGTSSPAKLEVVLIEPDGKPNSKAPHDQKSQESSD